MEWCAVHAREVGNVSQQHVSLLGHGQVTGRGRYRNVQTRQPIQTISSARASRTESHGTGVSCRLLLCWKYRCRVPVFVQLCDVFVSSRGCAQFVALNCFLSQNFSSPMNTLCAVYRCTSCCIARSTHVQHRAVPHRSCVHVSLTPRWCGNKRYLHVKAIHRYVHWNHGYAGQVMV
jgi:hypothetical protein